jgi:glycosyltransferase involved in cell wall biosynthesis
VLLLGVPAERVTYTYEEVFLPRELVERSEDLVAAQLSGSYGLEMQNYLLFYGALEPKKNVARLIDAYMLSAVDIPLVITGAIGWGNKTEAKRLEELGIAGVARLNGSRRIYHFEYVSLPMLVTLIRGARAVIFPSLYEGFGLPVLEAMLLGTPVVTSRASSLPEIAGEAALYVNPYDIDEIAQALKTIPADADLRGELVRRGRIQAELFSVARYRERIAALYERLG